MQSISVKQRQPGHGKRSRSDHSRVRMNTIAKSETTAVRLQKVCTGLIAGSRERLNQRHGSDRAAEHRRSPDLIPPQQPGGLGLFRDWGSLCNSRKNIRDVPGNGRLIKHALATAATRADEKPWTARFCFGYCARDCTGLPSLSAPLGSFACTLAVWASRSRCMRSSAWGARPP